METRGITPDLLEEFIRVLESPQSLKSEQRFKLLERAYLERNEIKNKKTTLQSWD